MPSNTYALLFSYCINGDNFTVTITHPGADTKAISRFSFKRFSKIVEYIDNKTFKASEVREDPLSPLERLDNILTEEKK